MLGWHGIVYLWSLNLSCTKNHQSCSSSLNPLFKGKNLQIIFCCLSTLMFSFQSSPYYYTIFNWIGKFSYFSYVTNTDAVGCTCGSFIYPCNAFIKLPFKTCCSVSISLIFPPRRLHGSIYVHDLCYCLAYENLIHVNILVYIQHL